MQVYKYTNMRVGRYTSIRGGWVEIWRVKLISTQVIVEVEV